MFTSDGAFTYSWGFGAPEGWLDTVTGKRVPEVYVYTHIMQNGLHIRAIVDDDEPDGVPWEFERGIRGLDLDRLQ